MLKRNLRIVFVAGSLFVSLLLGADTKAQSPVEAEPVGDVGGGGGGGAPVVCWEFDMNQLSTPCADFLPLNDTCADNGVGVACSSSSITVTRPGLVVAEPVQLPAGNPGMHIEDAVIPCIESRNCRYSYVFLRCVAQDTAWYVNGPWGKKNAGPCPTPVVVPPAP